MTNADGGHFSEEQIEQYSMGTLPEPQLERFEEHLLVCHECQDRLAEADDYVRAARSAAAELKTLPTTRERPRFGRFLREWLRPIPLAAAAAAAILLIWAGPRFIWPSLEDAPAIAVVLDTTRSVSEPSEAPAGRRLDLRLNGVGVAEHDAYVVELVDAAGRPVMETAARRQGETIRLASARQFEAGRYWVRVYGPSRTLLREYALTVK